MSCEKLAHVFQSDGRYPLSSVSQLGARYFHNADRGGNAHELPLQA